ncbi:MAG: transposase [Veillonella sp.]|nr:transposase [Veillonella sp.]
MNTPFSLYSKQSVLYCNPIWFNNILEERGVEDVALFVSDGFKGLKDICSKAFPKSRYQRCWVHISRNVRACVRKTDAKDVCDHLKLVY